MNKLMTIMIVLGLALLAVSCSCGGELSPESDGEEEEGGDVIQEGDGVDAPDRPRPDAIDGAEDVAEEELPECDCADDYVCDDGLYCNGAETCDGCHCQAGTPVDCADTVDCTDDQCLESTRECQHIPDHGFCDAGEMCDPDVGCVPATTCTTDGDCQDGYFCNGEEVCDTVSSLCVGGAAPDCSDEFSCTADTCVESAGQCENRPDDALCTGDGLFCTEERCTPLDPDAGADGCTSAARVCEDDGFQCTAESCNEEADMCESVPDDAVCADSYACNGDEVCAPADPGADDRGCIAGTDLDCSDAYECTHDSCVESSGCQHVPDNSLCNPGEICDPDSGCIPFTCATDEDCDDGFYCNGVETCDASHQCAAGTPPDCTDGIVCTNDLCDEDNDSCTNPVLTGWCLIGGTCYSNGSDNPDNICQWCQSATNNTDWTDRVAGTSCDDGLFCNGTNTCDGSGTCVAGTPPCTATATCTTATCDEVTDTCGYQVNTGFCYIDSACYANNDRNPANECEACISATSQTAWTPLNSDPSGTVLYPCASNTGVCIDGVCCIIRRPACSNGRDDDGNDLADWPDDPGCTNALDNTEGGPVPATPACSDGRDNDGDTLVDMRDPGCHSSEDNFEGNPHPACNDGRDNDADGLADFPDDPGCDSLSDDDETGGTACHQCGDGFDNDGDGSIDHPADRGCSSSADNDEWNPRVGVPECSDGADNDGDTLVDFPDDPGCFTRTDTSETDAFTFTPECSDGIDNDCDGRIDYPADTDCFFAGSDSERGIMPPFIPRCRDLCDNDGDTLVDFPADPGCASGNDDDERSPVTECSDRVDNDGDTLIDNLDAGCTSALDNFEGDTRAQCGDGFDNDWDGLIDAGSDPQCFSPSDPSESL
jgi:hypothetical protein